MDCEKVVKYLRGQISTYANQNSINCFVLGVSGGIDSALVAAICDRVIDVPLIGISLPSSTNKREEIDRARLIGGCFCSDFEEKNIDDEFKMFCEKLQLSESDKIRRGNVKARTRMMHLYDRASKTGGMVLSTDNFTELMLGFWSLHGDVGDYGLIQNYWKTEVYDIARWIADVELKDFPEHSEALRSCIFCEPTDGLGITNSDLDQIGVSSYFEVDRILKNYLNNKDGDVNHPVIRRHLNSQFKRNNPFNVPRML